MKNWFIIGGIMLATISIFDLTTWSIIAIVVGGILIIWGIVLKLKNG